MEDKSPPKLPRGTAQVTIEPVTDDAEVETSLRASPHGRFLLFGVMTPAAETRRKGLSGSLDPAGGDDETGTAYDARVIAMLEPGRSGKSIVSQEGAVDPAWFPDSRGFAFSMLQGSGAMIASSTIGDEPAAIRYVSPTPCVRYDKQPSVSRDGRLVLFTTVTEDEQTNVATMELPTTRKKCRILFPGQDPQWNPRSRSFVFTPDGGRIAFVSNRDGTPDIYVVDVDGTDLMQITRGPTTDRSPAWSADGSIYFVSNAGGRADIWRARLGSEEKVVEMAEQDTVTRAAEPPGDAAEVVQATPPGANFRAAAGTKSAILGTLLPGMRLTVLQRERGWLRVRTDQNQEGWIARRLTEPLSSPR